MKVSYKWSVHRNLIKTNIKSSLPTTMLYSAGVFTRMLSKFGLLVLKPSGGTGGHGVTLVCSNPKGGYTVQLNQNTKQIPDANSLIEWVKKLTNNTQTRYLVQECVSLAQIKGRPFTIRTITQRRSNSKWVLTGWVAKTAGKGFFITNGRSGGSVYTVEQAIALSNASKNSERILRDLRDISLGAAQFLGKTAPRQRVVGFDMGVDKEGKVWIIEANPKPRYNAFLKLKDHKMYRKIMDFQRSAS
ncbi:YheC/D like ATP-grasp [Marininema mesophilum]|uniref:YheC/D like ATP-grasp n=1 Tax=Marininema mesophilum TaxID=1048340 RepID=A0A1H2W7D3_9BACL|nr:YheC/YheD family protein [Marininema mesophilum]SDW76451.1 YheC/D like ATP-grasp [Marininema mesophilum]